MAGKVINFKLKGISPLLMSWDNLEFSDIVREWVQDPENKKGKQEAGSDRVPAFTWIGRLYHDGEYVALPAANLLTCLRDAGKMVTVPGGKGKTYKEATQTAIIFHNEFLQFEGGTKELKRYPIGPIFKLQEKYENDIKAHIDAVKDMGFKIDIRRASPQPGKKHIRCRPRFDLWQTSGMLTLEDADAMPLDRLKQIFEIAGFRKGLCDWRPGGKTPGPMGRFHVELKASK